MLWAADLTGPQPNDRQVAMAVTALMGKEHLSKHPLDDEMSRSFIGLISSCSTR